MAKQPTRYKTPLARAVATEFATDWTRNRYASDLATATGQRVSAVQHVLRRWVTDGWLDDLGWDPESRTPRRYYRVTEDGRVALAEYTNTQESET